MDIILDKRQSGRTTKLIELCHENGGYIVCPNARMCSCVASMARDLGLKIPFPMTYSEFLNEHYYGPGVKQVYVDDGEMLIDYLLRPIINPHIQIHTMDINKEYIDNLNYILSTLKITDVDGKDINLRIEIK